MGIYNPFHQFAVLLYLGHQHFLLPLTPVDLTWTSKDNVNDCCACIYNILSVLSTACLFRTDLGRQSGEILAATLYSTKSTLSSPFLSLAGSNLFLLLKFYQLYFPFSNTISHRLLRISTHRSFQYRAVQCSTQQYPVF